ncbi:MAG: hypothetical protein QNJ88_11895 [Acidimicrobiia bacterium]|nr:hypothetical protein [Acidimicrobiia bacterium]
MIFLILATLAGVIALAVRYRTDRRVAVDYLDAAKLIADDEQLLSAGLGEVFIGVGDLERQEILDRVEELASTSADVRDALAELETTAAVAEAHGFLTVAVGAWDDAFATMGDAIVEVLDGPDVQTGDAALRAAFDLLRIGDRAFFGFTEAVARIEADVMPPEYPAVAFAGGDRSALYDSVAIASRLRNIVKLEGDHDVSIIVTIDPEPLVQEGSIPIVPNAEQFIVNLVVSNEGNLLENRITVSLEGDPQSADVEMIDLQQLVPSLEAGSSTTVTFDVSDLVVPGELYELRARAIIPEDETPDNNSWSLVLVRNAE